MVASYYGKHFKSETLANLSGLNEEGVSLLGISEAAKKIGFKTEGIQLNYDELIDDAHLPCILHWNEYHFVVALPSKRRTHQLKIADPAKGVFTWTKNEILEQWANTEGKNGEKTGNALLLEPTLLFYQQPEEKRNLLTWAGILQYLRNSRWKLIQVFIILLAGSLIQFIIPFLTRNIVDKGITTKNISFVTLVLLGQLMLTVSRTGMDFIKTRLLFRISTNINLSILSDFWVKLTKLPISYFENHHTGDTLQRISDHRQIESFLTGTAISTFFSLLNFIVFAIVLILYNTEIFYVFAVGSLLYLIWIKYFLRIRRKINYEIFNLSSKENNAALQLIQGMQEIKLHNAEKAKRLEWEALQSGFYKLSFRSLSYNQVQQSGALLLNEGRNFFITFLVAKYVIDGRLTLGTMLAVQYIIGQLSSPIEQFIGFIQTGQDARISMERLNEIHQLPDEEIAEKEYLHFLPENKTIELRNLSFAYPGAGDDYVLNNINLKIFESKVTAIVGMSGSGKTTLLKLLLRFFENYQGEITIGDKLLAEISPSFWRKQCGAVLQNGFIFNDSIDKNIVVNNDPIDIARLKQACQTANVLSFIESLPNGFNTKLGGHGTSMSEGQKQRLLIARSIYKNPTFLFFDEATNSLDANNERAIVENLQKLFSGKTVVIVAHRLSTVKNADKIVVLDRGKIVEEGDHKYLIALKGKYYELVKNQLDLGI